MFVTVFKVAGYFHHLFPKINYLPVSVLLQCRTHCLLLRLSLSAAQSLYLLSPSCCSADHTVCYCAYPSLLHSHCTFCFCPAAVQNTLSATVPVPLCCTVTVPSVSVLLQCRSHCLLLCLSLCCTVSVPSVSVLLQCRTHCLILCRSLSAAQSVYCLSLSCCSAEHTVCY
jgi:hypothetical protein